MDEQFYVVKRKWEKFVGVMSGVGKHKGTWDAGWKQKRTAKKHADAMNAELTREDINAGIHYHVESNYA